MTTIKNTTNVPRILATVGLILACIVALYLLPIWTIALYLAIAQPYESGIGWIMVAMVYFGFLIIPILTIPSLIFSIVALVKDRAAKTLPLVSFGILAAATLITVIIFSVL